MCLTGLLGSLEGNKDASMVCQCGQEELGVSGKTGELSMLVRLRSFINWLAAVSPLLRETNINSLPLHESSAGQNDAGCSLNTSHNFSTMVSP